MNMIFKLGFILLLLMGVVILAMSVGAVLLSFGVLA